LHYAKYLSIFVFTLFLCKAEKTTAQVSRYTGNLIIENAEILEKEKYWLIHEIQFEGNDKTRDFIIQRELSVDKGSLINASDIESQLENDRKNIFNTALFNRVDIVVSQDSIEPSLLNIRVVVEERWYLFPMPIFELADRNFNEWWETHNADFSRTYYGMRFSQKNFRGRNEELRWVAHFGYMKKFELFYIIPYITKNYNEGLRLAVSYSDNNSIAYATENNRLQNYSADKIIRDRFFSAINFSFREGIHQLHDIEVGFNRHRISDAVAELNPEYFGSGETSQKYFRLSYRFRLNHTDISAYPLSGYYLNANAFKYGLGVFNDVDLLGVHGSFHKYVPLSNRLFSSAMLGAGYTSQKDNIPYNLKPGLGYGQNFVRGYEHYVMDAYSWSLIKSTLKFELFSSEYSLGRLMPLRQFRTVPVGLYFKVFGDLGYASGTSIEMNEPFNNMWLRGLGTGFDIVTFYDNVFRIEYSINHTGEAGIYLHFRADI
jgi:outer membrane protein assembly factor BamA